MCALQFAFRLNQTKLTSLLSSINILFQLMNLYFAEEEKQKGFFLEAGRVFEIKILPSKR